MPELQSVMSERQPSTEEIARRAYAIFLSRGGQHGYDVDDWLQAEYELRKMPTSQVAPFQAPVPVKNRGGRKRKSEAGIQQAA
jgi:hypothetical protein